MKPKIMKDDGTPKGAWIAIALTIAWLFFSWGLGVYLIISEKELSASLTFYYAYSGTTVSFVGAYFFKKFGDGKNGNQIEIPDDSSGGLPVNLRDDGGVSELQNIKSGIGD